MIEIKTTKEIIGSYDLQETKEELEKKWVAVADLMALIDKRRDEGNISSRGFSAGLFLSELIKILEQSTEGKQL